MGLGSTLLFSFSAPEDQLSDCDAWVMKDWEGFNDPVTGSPPGNPDAYAFKQSVLGRREVITGGSVSSPTPSLSISLNARIGNA